MNAPPTEAGPRVLATSTLCTVKELGDDVIELQVGAAVLRLSSRDVASLTGTLRKVVRQVFTPAKAPRRAPFVVIEGGKI